MTYTTKRLTQAESDMWTRAYLSAIAGCAAVPTSSAINERAATLANRALADALEAGILASGNDDVAALREQLRDVLDQRDGRSRSDLEHQKLIEFAMAIRPIAAKLAAHPLTAALRDCLRRKGPTGVMWPQENLPPSVQILEVEAHAIDLLTAILNLPELRRIARDTSARGGSTLIPSAPRRCRHGNPHGNCFDCGE